MVQLRNFACVARAFVVFFLLSMAADWARAEAQPLQVYTAGPLVVAVTNPNLSTDGAWINCSPEQPGCVPLNVAACESPTLPIGLTVSLPLNGSAPAYSGSSQPLYAYLSRNSSCIYSAVTGQIGSNSPLIGSNSALAASSVFFAGGSRPFVFPRDLAAANGNVTQLQTTGVFTTIEMMKALDVCPQYGGTPVDLTPIYLCIGVDASAKNGVNNGSNATTSTSASNATSTTATTGQATTTNNTNSSSGDIVAILQLQVDTRPPQTPTGFAVQEKNGRLAVTVDYDTSALDVDALLLQYTDNADDLALLGTVDPADSNRTLGCEAWQHAKTIRQNVRGQTEGHYNLRINKLQNNTTYGVCSHTVDYLRNNSIPSTVVFATPRFECDLFACYPGELQLGYCASGSLPALWSSAAGLCAFAAHRRRRRTQAQKAAQKASRATTRLLLLLLCALTPARAAWAQQGADTPSAGVQYRPVSESPVESRRNLPRGDADDTYDADLTAKRRASVVFSDGNDAGLSYVRPQAARPQYNIDFSVGPYRPQVGQGQAGRLYDLVYAQKDGSLFAGRPLRYSLGFSYFIWRNVGVTGPFARIGFWRGNGRTRVCSDAQGQPTACTAETILQSAQGNDSAALLVLPVSFGWTYRYEGFKRIIKVPLGVGARLGLDGHLWWGSSAGSASKYNGRSAHGATWTPHMAAQLNLDLTALTAKTRSGSTSALLFAEYQYIPNGALWGKRHSQRLSMGDARLISVGLSVHFNR